MKPGEPEAAAPIPEPKVGDVLAGKYRIEAILGKGGMGLVVAATHLQLGQLVAIKFLFQPGNRDVVARFLREARAAVRLRSEHVARVIDVGELENGAPYMVMEHLRGDDLNQLIRVQGALPIVDAVDYVLQTCEAMGEAHAAGIIHRDLKPANLFLTTTPDGAKCVKVIDFGISKAGGGPDDQGSEGMQLTKTQTLLGSPLYMSPEQLKASRDVDARADIWAIGVILYQLLTARIPFNTAVFTELVLKVNLEAPTPIATYRTDVPPGLEAAVLKCLEKKASDRFQNVAELALAIADFGPLTARISAEKTARVLEAAGQKVHTPPGFIRGSLPSIPGAATSPGLVTGGSWVPPMGVSVATGAGVSAIDQLGNTEPSLSASVATAVVASTAVGRQASSPPPPARRGLAVGLSLAALAVGAVSAAVLLRGASGARDPAATGVTDVKPVSVPSSSVAVPQVEPAGSAPPAASSSASPPAASIASANTAPSAQAPAASASARGAPHASVSKSNGLPSTPPATPTSTATANNPFNKAGALGEKY